MWCRVILTITLLACTFQRTNGQSHDTKDLLCVLVLSGLQKEDLDVALLRKLRRHNVNVDDLDNADIRNECKLENANTSDNETKNDVQKPEPMRRHFQENQTASGEVENQTIELNTTKDEENITKLIKLISSITPEVKQISSITPEVNIHNIKEDTTTTEVITTVKPHKSEPNSITYINKILQQFIAQIGTAPTTTTPTTTTTTTPTTTVDLKSILYEIKEMLANKTVNGRMESTENKNGRQEYNYDNDNFKIKVYTKAINDKMMNKKIDLRRQKENSEFLVRSQEVLNERPIKEVTKSPSTSQPLPKNRTTDKEKQNDIKTIQRDIIKDIADSVKALLLKDLKKEISTTISTSTTDVETTTLATTKEDNDFARFIQLFQHFKNNIVKKPLVNKNLTDQTHHGITSGINVTPSLIKMPNNPYNNPIIRHIIHNFQGPALTNLNTELESLPIYKSHTINRIDQVNIFNPKQEMPPITIQTNVGQVPPLKIPMMAPPIKMIYQNIVVTTENSFEHYKNIHRLKSIPNLNVEYSYNNYHKRLNSIPQHAYTKQADSPKQHDYVNLSLKPFDHTKYHYQVERMRTPPHHISSIYIPKQKYVRPQNRNFEKFHEKLEKADREDWQKHSNEHNEEKLKVAPRHLKPLNDNKTFDDTHFKNFLKTQQKVNDMLERILATKTDDGPRPVETL